MLPGRGVTEGGSLTRKHGGRSSIALAVVALLWNGAANGQSAQVPAAPAKAAPAAPIRSDDPAFLSVGVGAYDVLHNNTAGEIRGEYRFSQKLWIFKPFLGMEGTTKRAFYGYGGFLVDIYLGNRWVIMPNAAFGYYENGAGKDLGSHAEFRTGAEFAYRFNDRSRLGFTFHHISNAGINKKTNPGEEEMLVVFSLPFDLLK
jgi:lipid A 3-O-deacylase